MEEQNKKDSLNHFEPTISDLEWVIAEFRKNHGEAELSALLQDFVMPKNSDTKTEEEPKKDTKTAFTPLEFVNSASDHTADSGNFSQNFTVTEENYLDNVKAKLSGFSYFENLRGNFVITTLQKNLKKIIKNKYFKKAAIFIGLYFIIYMAISSPMYLERVKFAFNPTETIKVMEEEIVNTPMADSAPLDPGEVIPAGSVLSIPKINVNAPIIHSSSQTEEQVQADLKSGVAKYKGTADPGEVGNTFIVGHSSGYFWDKSQYKYVFILLDKMEVGDNAKIYSKNKKYVYQVVEKKVVEPTDVSVIAQTDEPYLTLMTCYPPGTTSKRLIVKMKQISPEYIKPKVVLKEKDIEVPKYLPTSDTRSVLDKIFFFWR